MDLAAFARSYLVTLMKSFFLFGQSNMAGADAVPGEPWKKEPADERSILYKGTVPGGDFQRHPLEPILDSTERKIHGPEIGFARGFGEPCLLVKVTGNIPPEETKFLWGENETYMRTALGYFARVSQSAPAAIMTDQGIDEACSPNRWANYKVNLKATIEGLRSHFGDSDLPFIIGQSPFSPYAENERMASVRQAQEEVSSELPCIGFFSIDDLAPFVRGHHLTSNAQLEFGYRFAHCYARLCK